MSSPSLQRGDDLLSTTQKPTVVVQVDELSVESPTAEATEVLSRRVEVGKIATIAHQDDLEHFTVPVAWSRTMQVEQGTPSAMSVSVQRSSSHEILWCPEEGAEEDDDVNRTLRRRTHRMQLPSFRSLGIASSDSEYFGRRPTLPTERRSSPSTRPSLQAGRAAAQSLPLPSSENIRPFLPNLGNTPLLTPPEDADSIKWNNALLHNPAHPNEGQSSSTGQSATIVMASRSPGAQQSQSVPPISSPSTRDSSRELQGGGSASQQRIQQVDDGNRLSRSIRPFSKYRTPSLDVPTLI
jgi:hypothetical protein